MRARRASQISTKKLLPQATSTISQTRHEPTAIFLRSIPASPVADRANSRAQPWIQAVNPNLEPLGNHKGDLSAQIKPEGVAKPVKQQDEEGRHRTRSITKKSLAGKQGGGRGAIISGNWPLVLEHHRAGAEQYVVYLHLAQDQLTYETSVARSSLRVITAQESVHYRLIRSYHHFMNQFREFYSIFGSEKLISTNSFISLTSPMRVTRAMASRVDSSSRGRWADSLAGPEGGAMLYADGDRLPSSSARLIQSVSQALDDAEPSRVTNQRYLRSGNFEKNAFPLEKNASKSAVHLRTLPVPRPTEAYLVQASQPTQKLSRPRSILVILDLNGTLLYRKDRSRPRDIIARPRVKDFLQYLLSKFSVMVWSSATPPSVAAMCSKLFSGEQRRLLVAEWARDKLGLSPEQYAQKVQVYKQLSAVWDSDIAASHPEYNTGGHWDQSNTILLDDSALKASAQPYNHILVPEYKGNHEPGDGRSVFSQVISYLEVIILQRDVSSYIQKAPFRVAEEWDTWCSSR
jgi:NLI interacting factor-like phosphatase